MASFLALDEGVVREASQQPTFGAAWADVEAISPRLRRHRVAVADLASEMAQASEIRALLRGMTARTREEAAAGVVDLAG